MQVVLYGERPVGASPSIEDEITNLFNSGKQKDIDAALAFVARIEVMHQTKQLIVGMVPSRASLASLQPPTPPALLCAQHSNGHYMQYSFVRSASPTEVRMLHVSDAPEATRWSESIQRHIVM